MSEKSSIKLVRNGQSMNTDDKKRSKEDEHSSKKKVENKFQIENETKRGKLIGMNRKMSSKITP